MTIVPPLQVRLISRGASRNISPDLVDDLTFSNSAPGGYRSASCKLARPLHLPTTELRAFTQMEVIDQRNGGQVFYGRLEDPGRSSDGGAVWSLGAVGAGSHAKDNTLPVVYVDRRTQGWERYEEAASAGGNVGQAAENDPDNPATLFSFPRGTALQTNTRVVQRYRYMAATGQRLALLRGKVIFGRVNASLQGQVLGRNGPGADANLKDLVSTTSETTQTARIGVDFTSLHTHVEYRLIWTGAAVAVADDLTWEQLRDVLVVPTRLSRLGVEVVTSGEYPAADTVAVHSIVEDVLGRFCPEWDRAAAIVDTSSTVGVRQMAYEDATTAEQVLDDLMALAPTHYWAAWGNPGGKGARFSWLPWPTFVALDGLDTNLDGFSATGSGADLFNRVTVRWKHRNGNTVTTTRTADNPTLTAAGLTRHGLLDLGGQIGDREQAQAAGDAWLAAHKWPQNSGTIKVSRPLVDQSTGRTLQPWELRAGVLARVRNLAAQPDGQNTQPDGSTVFRVSDVAYSAKANEATLTLDSYGRTVARALARLAKSAERQRRV